ncbi:MAG: LamG domain-containing protein, partial [Pseudomonadota bacterium]
GVNMMVKLRCRLRTVLLIAIGLSWFSGAMADLSDGLVAYYAFDGNAQDESGNGNHGTVHGATLTDDRFGNLKSAYEFDGSNDYIEAPTNFTHTTFTVGAWIKLKTHQCYGGIVDGYHNKWEFVMDCQAGGKKLEFAEWKSGGGYNEHRASSTLNTSQWYHVAVVIDNTSGSFYINGQFDSTFTMTASALTPVSKFIIGASLSGTAQYFNGNIDDIRIYNRAISKSEIQQLYHYKGCQPSIDIKLNSNNRVTGDKVVINAQIKGPGNSDSSCEQTQVEQKVWIKLPDDSVIPLIAPFTVLTLLPGDDIESKIFECTFSGASPIGSYQIGGRLLHPFSGDTISTDIEVLTFSQ